MSIMPIRWSRVSSFSSAARVLLATGCVCATSVWIGCGGGGSAPQEGIQVANVGFMSPQSAIYDSVADVYLVSNVNGAGATANDNGFISQVTPDGQVAQLKWIDGQTGDFTLNAPKGMAIRGDTLFVADITCIRLFDRASGAHISGSCLDGVTFLKGIAVGPQGSLFVTDMGMKEGAAGQLVPSGTDALYRLPMRKGLRGATLAKTPDLGGPSGVAVGPRGIFVVTYRTGAILAFNATGDETQVAPPAPRVLDGIVFDGDGGFEFSDWTDSTVYRARPDGNIEKLVQHVASPAGIGYDAKRNRLLIPQLEQNALLIRDIH